MDVVPSNEHSEPLAPWSYVHNLHKHKPGVMKMLVEIFKWFNGILPLTSFVCIHNYGSHHAP